jgi:hypothetical protein
MRLTLPLKRFAIISIDFLLFLQHITTMKAKELLALELEVLPPFVVYVDGKPMDSNSFPIGIPRTNEGGHPYWNIPVKFTGTKDEAEIFAMMPDMFRALHSLVKGRKKAAEFKAAFPRDYQAIQTIVNSVMERCDAEITGRETPKDFETDKKGVDNSRHSG